MSCDEDALTRAAEPCHGCAMLNDCLMIVIAKWPHCCCGKALTEGGTMSFTPGQGSAAALPICQVRHAPRVASKQCHTKNSTACHGLRMFSPGVFESKQISSQQIAWDKRRMRIAQSYSTAQQYRSATRDAAWDGHPGQYAPSLSLHPVQGRPQSRHGCPSQV